jgi:hypothetical protein
MPTDIVGPAFARPVTLEPGKRIKNGWRRLARKIVIR